MRASRRGDLGGVAIRNRYRRRSIPPELIAGLRTMLAGVILVPLAFSFRNTLPLDRLGRVELIIGACFGFALYPLVLSVGILKTSVTHASIILAAAPIFTGLLTFSLTRKWPKAVWWIGSVVAIGGVATLMAWRGPSQIGKSATIWGEPHWVCRRAGCLSPTRPF